MSNYSDSQYSDEGGNTSWQKVLKLIPPEAKVLDVGCSSGNFGLALIEKKGCVVDGLELDVKDAQLAAKKLRKVYNLNVETDSLESVKDTYDIIYFGDVIEHLVDPVKGLKKVQSLLAKDGVVIFSIPNMAHITIRLLLLGGDFEYTETGLLDKTHLHFYNLKEINRVFNEAGFAIETLDYVEKDYPDQLIRQKLKELGLEARKDSEFLKASRNIDAAAFQFVGVAKPTKNLKVKKLAQFGPIDMFESYHTNIVKGLEDQISELTRDAMKWREFKKNPTKTILKKLLKR